MTSSVFPSADSLPAQPEILLVDDDTVNLMLTALALRERGFGVVEVDGGEKALELLRHWTPDIVVLDAMMPGLDGFETCQELRNRSGFENVPVLMLTGLDDDASIARAYQVGATDFFVKATQWSLLAGRLQYLLRSSRTRIELERNRAKLARAQDLARMGSFDWRRARGGGVLLSPEALRVFGFGPTEQIGLRMLLRMVPLDGRRTLSKEMHRALRQGNVLTIDVPVVLQDMRLRIVHVEAEPDFSEKGHNTGYAGIVQDVTDRRQAEDKIRELANFDALTGLPNRRQLLWRAERALEHARRLQHPFAILLIDLDRFKLINDRLGHSAGDELLIEVGRRLRACVRHSDQVVDGTIEAAGVRAHRALEAVGRLGGDEFVALLPEVSDTTDTDRVALRILEALREPIFVGGRECFVTASVGMALFPQHGSSVVDLLRNADAAMYAAKRQGKDAAIIYSPDLLSGPARDNLEMETALHKAMERDELVLHYQPKIDVRTSRMVGVEALMRWQRGNELVPPGQFIPLAEETGLIVPMSLWLLRQAAKQARLWKLAFGFEDAIAVNLPTRMFERSDLVDNIHQYCAAYEVPTSAIQLEIIENHLMNNLEVVIPTLHRLYQIGIEIAIDDFGTGYSSLAYLTQLPISELKIDKGFVKDIGTSAQNLAVVQAIIALGRSLGMRVVAEGVENLRQQDELRKADCRYMQGFLFNKALPPDELQAWLEQTVLPRAAPWMGQGGDNEYSEDLLRAAGRRPFH